MTIQKFVYIISHPKPYVWSVLKPWKGLWVLCPNLINWWMYVANLLCILKPNKLYEFHYKNGLEILFRGRTSDVDINCEIFGYEDYISQEGILPFSEMNHVVDLGAQTGVFALYALAKNPNLNIISVEAVKANFDILQKNIEINNFTERVTLVHRAAWGKSGEMVEIHLNPKNTGGHSVEWENKMTNDGGIVKVPTISLDESIGEHSCDLLKVDIEGAEYSLFEGADISTLRKIKSIVMETHGSKQKDMALISKLQSAGLTVLQQGSYLRAWRM